MNYDWLPPLLAEIADVAGLPAALALAETRGGSRITIPARPRPDHWIVRTIGPEAAERLCAHFRVGAGGTIGATVELPVGPSGSAAAARAKIDAMLRQGLSADKIAVIMRVHRTTVFRRKARIDGPHDPRQISMFD